MASDRLRAWRPFLREPLLHFTLIGALLFGGSQVFAKPTQEITVSAKQRAQLEALFEQRQQRKPAPNERAELVDRYVDDEVLFREGLARGVVLEDPGIRDQVIGRMQSILQGSVMTAIPSDQELEAFYKAHLDHYALPAAVSFTEYVLPGETEEVARALAQALRAGTPVARTLRVHRERSRVQLQALYGPEVAEQIFRLPSGGWEILYANENPRVVRVDSRRDSVQRELGEAKDQVSADYQSERIRTAVDEALKELRGRFSVNVEAR